MSHADALTTSARPRIRPEGPTMTSPSNAMARMLLWVLTLLALLVTAGAQAQNNAAFVSQSVPTTMLTGTVYNVTVTLSNNGSTTWTGASSYFLGSQNPPDNGTWGGGRVALPASVGPGGQASFAFQVTAPSTPGSYNFQWRLLREGVEWFGALSSNVAVTVSAPPPHNDAQVMAVSVPPVMTQGQSYTVAVTMKNTGNTTWPAGSAYNLGTTNPYNNMVWGVKRAPVNNTVGPGQQITFSFPVVAPAAGSYTMNWGMVQEYIEWFGPSSSSPVTVNAASATPTISVTRTPATMIAGQSYSLVWSSSSATSLSRVCTSTGTGYTVSDAPAINGGASGTASAAWVGFPSACTWRATGAGGTATFNETMTTNVAPASDVVTYIHTDGLGSPVARTDAAGNLVSRTRYEPYGLTAAGATPTIGFTGHVNDADTGLVYMQQRYYDPVAGRFLSIDPVTTDANTGGSFNRYAYSNNNPYKYIDPDGRNPLLIIPIAGAVIGGGINAAMQYSSTGTVQWGGLGGVLDAAGDGFSFGMLGLAGAGRTAVTTGPIEVTKQTIATALKGSTMKSAQPTVSLPVVEAYVRKIEAGGVAPAISVDGKIIVEGNHRYVAGRVAGKEPATKPGTISPSQESKAKPIQEIKVDPVDHGNR